MHVLGKRKSLKEIHKFSSKSLEKEQNKPQSSRRKEIIKKGTEKTNEAKSWLFVKIKKIAKPLAGLTKKTKMEDKTQVTNSGMK